MKDKNKKLVLNKNTAKTLKTQTSVKTGTLYVSVEGRSSAGGSIAGSIAGSDVTLTTYQPIGY
jgi:hypothetical protein